MCIVCGRWFGRTPLYQLLHAHSKNVSADRVEQLPNDRIHEVVHTSYNRSPLFRPFILVSIRVVSRRHSGRLYNYMWWIYLGLFNYITRFRYLYPPSSHVESEKPHKLSVYALDYDYCSHSALSESQHQIKQKIKVPSTFSSMHNNTVTYTQHFLSCVDRATTYHARRQHTADAINFFHSVVRTNHITFFFSPQNVNINDELPLASLANAS